MSESPDRANPSREKSASPTGTSATAPPPSAAGTETLGSLSFLSLLAMQALTVTNDNIFRWLAVGIGKQYVSPAQESMVLSIGTVSFVLPYLLLAAPAGYLADRFAKRQVILVCKFAEILLMLLAVAAIAAGSLTSLFIVLALMGAQAALFSPARLMSLPEMLKPSKLSAANGCMGLTTVLAMVLGAGVGNWLTDATGKFGQEKLWLSASVLVGIALTGWAVSWCLRHIDAANPRLPFPWNAIPQTIRDLRELGRHGGLFRVALGIAFFWSLGALAQLNIDRFAFEKGRSSRRMSPRSWQRSPWESASAACWQACGRRGGWNWESYRSAVSCSPSARCCSSSSKARWSKRR